jgi:hypothetical protein
VKSPDGQQVWMIFHATPTPGNWLDRKARCQLLGQQGGLPFSNSYPAPPTTVTVSGGNLFATAAAATAPGTAANLLQEVDKLIISTEA